MRKNFITSISGLITIFLVFGVMNGTLKKEGYIIWLIGSIGGALLLFFLAKFLRYIYQIVKSYLVKKFGKGKGKK